MSGFVGFWTARARRSLAVLDFQKLPYEELLTRDPRQQSIDPDFISIMYGLASGGSAA